MSADWGSSGDYWGNTPTYDYSQPTYDYSQPTYDYSQPVYSSDPGYYQDPVTGQTYDSSQPVAPDQSSYDQGQYGPTPGGGNIDNGGQYGPTPGGGNIDNGYGGLPQYDDNGNPMPAGVDAYGRVVDYQGNPLPMGGTSIPGPQQGGTPRYNYTGNGQQAGPPNPYPGGQSPNYNYPGGMNNPYGQQGGNQQNNGGLLGGLFGGGNQQGGGGGGLFGGSTGSDLLTLLGVGGALAFLPKLLNSASGGSSGTTVTAPDYSAQWRNLPALPNYTPQFAQAGTNPGMQMSANPFGAVTAGGAPGVARVANNAMPIAQGQGPIAPQ